MDVGSFIAPHATKLYLLFALFVSVPFLFWEFVPGEPLVNRTAACTLFISILWMTEALPVSIVSLFPLVLFPFFQILDGDEVAEEYFNDTTYVFLGSTLVAYAMEKWGLHRRLTLRVLLFVGSKPLLLLAGFMGTTFFISMFISNSATCAMVMPLVLSIIRTLPNNLLPDPKASATSSSHFVRRDENGTREKKRRDNAEKDIEKQPLTAKSEENNITLHPFIDTKPLQIEVISETGLDREPSRGSTRSSHSDDDTYDDSDEATESASEISAQKKFCVGMLLAIAYAASLGGTATLIGTGTNLAFAQIYKSIFPSAPPLSFLAWTVFTLPQAALFLAFTFLVLYLIFCREAVNRDLIQFDGDALQREYDQLKEIGPEELIVLCVSTILVGLWFTKEAWTGIFANFVDYGTVTMLCTIALLLLPAPSHPGRTVLDWDDILKVPWGIVFLMGAGFAVAESFEQSGLSLWVAQRVAGLRHVGVFWLTSLVCLVVTFLTELTSNVATANILLPILAATAVAIGEHPLLLMVPATLACSNAFMLPVATPPNAIVFSSGMVKISQMATAGLFLNLIGVLLNSGWIFLFGRVFEIHLHQLPHWANATVV